MTTLLYEKIVDSCACQYAPTSSSRVCMFLLLLTYLFSLCVCVSCVCTWVFVSLCVLVFPLLSPTYFLCVYVLRVFVPNYVCLCLTLSVYFLHLPSLLLPSPSLPTHVPTCHLHLSPFLHFSFLFSTCTQPLLSSPLCFIAPEDLVLLFQQPSP
jgi:hypothetical protein